MSELGVVDLPVLDVTHEEARDAIEVTEAQLTSNDYRHCRRVTALVRSRPDRYGGILAPSAAKQGAQTLAVSQDWLGNVTVTAFRRQTPPRRLLPLFEEIAKTLPRSR